MKNGKAFSSPLFLDLAVKRSSLEATNSGDKVPQKIKT